MIYSAQIHYTVSFQCVPEIIRPILNPDRLAILQRHVARILPTPYKLGKHVLVLSRRAGQAFPLEVGEKAGSRSELATAALSKHLQRLGATSNGMGCAT